MGIPPSVEMLLEWWIDQLQPILSGNMHSVVLFGSVTLDDFQPGWSDVDACIVLRRPITESEAQQVGQVHDEMKARFAQNHEQEWPSPQVVEGPYVPLSLALGEIERAECFYAGGRTRKWDIYDPVSAFDRYMLANHGHVFHGAPIDFAPPRMKDLAEMAGAGVKTFLNWRGQSAHWLASHLQWVPRNIMFWRDGRMLSKTAALEHEITNGSPYADAFRLALKLRRKTVADAHSCHGELEKHFENIAEDAAREMDELVRNTDIA